MDPRIPHIILDPRNKHHDLFPRPAQTPRQQSQAHGFRAACKVLVRPEAQLLKVLVLGPAVLWPHEGDLDNVDETSVGHELRCTATGIERVSDLVGGFLEVCGPAVEGGVREQRTIIAPDWKINILNLNIAA